MKIYSNVMQIQMLHFLAFCSYPVFFSLSALLFNVKKSLVQRPFVVAVALLRFFYPLYGRLSYRSSMIYFSLLLMVQEERRKQFECYVLCCSICHPDIRYVVDCYLHIVLLFLIPFCLWSLVPWMYDNQTRKTGRTTTGRWLLDATSIRRMETGRIVN